MKYYKIEKDNMDNGEGMRVVLWTAGCSHHCFNCHNQFTWDYDGGIEFTEESKAEIYDQLSQDHIKGITFSGGDPLFHHNRKDIGKLILDIREDFPDKSIWLYTGYGWEFLVETRILPLHILACINVIVDGPFVESLKDTSLLWKGSSNQRVIDNLQSLFNLKIVLYEK